MSDFSGFSRKHGPAGIRNHVLVVSGEIACNPWTLDAASRVEGACALTHKCGAGNIGPDRDVFSRLLSGAMTHPSVFGAVLIASGNEDYVPSALAQTVRRTGRAARVVSAKRIACNTALIVRAAALARDMANKARRALRTPADLSALRIGLNCAGTDIRSRDTSNAVCGAAMDWLVGRGATVLLTEVPEMIGAEKSLFARCASTRVRTKLARAIREQKGRLQAAGPSVDDNEMCRFNREGRLSTLKQKAGISILKAGTTPINEVVEYGRAPSRTGLVVMDGPALTDFVVTGFLGAGAHLMVNCCGVGPANRMPFAVGADAEPPMMPVLKVTGSSKHARDRTCRIDFDAGSALKDPKAVAVLGRKLAMQIVRVASGKTTRTERACDFLMNVPLRHHQA